MSSEILLIEDDDSLNRAISLKLSKEGYTVHSAMSAKEAEAAWKAHKVSLVICDVDLPDGSGRLYYETFLYAGACIKDSCHYEKICAGSRAGDTCIRLYQPVYYRKPCQKERRIYYAYGKGAKTAFLFYEKSYRILSKNQLLEALWDVDGDFVDDSMDEELNIGRQAIILIKYPMYMILIMIAVIGFMNLINTMIISIVTRKHELGILQAIGLSDRQLTKMLAGEGLVFTVGTLLASISKRVHKESLIERIRSE